MRVCQFRHGGALLNVTEPYKVANLSLDRKCLQRGSLNQRSIPLHARFNLYRPLVDPPSHALSRWKTLLPQPNRHLRAASTMVAVNDQPFALMQFQLIDASCYLAHRQQYTLVDRHQVAFGLLSTID